MKLITDEQYAAINELIQSLQFFAKDFGKSLLKMKYHPLFKDDQVSIDLMEKSLKGEDWAIDIPEEPENKGCLICKDENIDVLAQFGSGQTAKYCQKCWEMKMVRPG